MAAVSAGGGIGSTARYLLTAAVPAGTGFPWAVFAVNVSGPSSSANPTGTTTSRCMPRSFIAHTSSGLAGASVFRGIEGFGAASRIHTSRLLSLSEDLPSPRSLSPYWSAA